MKEKLLEIANKEKLLEIVNQTRDRTITEKIIILLIMVVITAGIIYAIWGFTEFSHRGWKDNSPYEFRKLDWGNVLILLFFSLIYSFIIFGGKKDKD